MTPDEAHPQEFTVNFGVPIEGSGQSLLSSWPPEFSDAEEVATAVNKKRKTSAREGDLPGFLHDYCPEDGQLAGEEAFDRFNWEQQGSKAPKRVCDIVNQITYTGNCLKFDPSTEQFTVTDGPQFQREFLALKTVRADKAEAQGRTFAQMYRTYQIVSGEKWGCAGTVFKAKKKDIPLPFPAPKDRAASPPGRCETESPCPCPADGSRGTSMQRFESDNQVVPASRVALTLDDGKGKTQAVSLQQFLDVTGAGELYSEALARSHANKGDKHAAAPDPMDWIDERRREELLQVGDVGEVVGGLWDATSKGDQAYFFKRRAGFGAVENGAIVGLVGGELVASSEVERAGAGMHMVVSDLNAKWKGEPIPTKEQEETGHWCCFLGQVPVTVEGVVRCGELIGPSPHATGTGRVTALGAGPVVGVALADKAGAGAGAVKVLCFAGLGAMSGAGAADYDQLLDQALAMERRVEKVEEEVREVKVHVTKVDDRVATCEEATTRTAVRVEELEKEVGGLRRVFGQPMLSTKQLRILFGVVLLLALVVTVSVVLTRRQRASLLLAAVLGSLPLTACRRADGSKDGKDDLDGGGGGSDKMSDKKTDSDDDDGGPGGPGGGYSGGGRSGQGGSDGDDHDDGSSSGDRDGGGGGGRRDRTEAALLRDRDTEGNLNFNLEVHF